jgi:hypothetical protein
VGRNSEHPKISKRLLKDYIQRPAEQLFGLENDPREANNLAGEPEYADKLKEMRGSSEIDCRSGSCGIILMRAWCYLIASILM